MLRDELVGIVSRADLLRALEGVEPEAEVDADTLAVELRGLTELQPSSTPSPRSAIAPRRVYLVGGTIRDILLGEESFDVDIAVEGDAIGSQVRSPTLGGRTTPHEKFGTAIVSTGTTNAWTS